MLNFGSPGRKDDLVSLCYLILSLNGDLDIFKQDTSHMDSYQYYRHVLNLKLQLTVDDFIPDNHIIKPFMKEVWNLKYDSEPDYEKLRFLMVNILL